MPDVKETSDDLTKAAIADVQRYHADYLSQKSQAGRRQALNQTLKATYRAVRHWYKI